LKETKEKIVDLKLKIASFGYSIIISWFQTFWKSKSL